MKSSTCLLCGYSPLLRQTRHNQVFFYCPSCRQEMTFSASECTNRHYYYAKSSAQPLVGVRSPRKEETAIALSLK